MNRSHIPPSDPIHDPNSSHLNDTTYDLIAALDDEPSSSLSLERMILLKYLYPQHLLDYFEDQTRLRYSSQKAYLPQNITNSLDIPLSAFENRISYCEYLTGYDNSLVKAFSNTVQVKKILKDSQSHIISLKKYLKYKAKFLEAHKEYEGKSSDGILKMFSSKENQQISSILVTFNNSLDALKSRLRDILSQDNSRPEGSEKMQKTTKLFKFSQLFEEEPIIDPASLKQLMRQYENLVSIRPKVTMEKGRYRLSFTLTTFSRPFLLEPLEKELSDLVSFKKQIDFNHFEFAYYKRVIYPKLKHLEMTRNIEVFFRELEIDWNCVHDKSYIVSTLTIQGEKNHALEFYFGVTKELETLIEKRLEIPFPNSDKIYYDFRESITAWVTNVSGNYEDIVFSNHTLCTKKEQGNPQGKRFATQNSIVLYTIGPETRKEQVEEASNFAEEELSNITFRFFAKTVAQIKEVALDTGYKNLSEMEYGFDLIISDAIKKEKKTDPTVLHGREKDIQEFERFMMNNRRLVDLENKAYQRILQRNTETFHSLALQWNISVKLHPHVPLIQLSGDNELLDDIVEVLKMRIKQLKEQVKYYEVDGSVLAWVERLGNVHLLRHLEREYCVTLVQFENRKEKKIGIIGEKGHEECLEELKLYVFGKTIEREVKMADLGNIHKATYCSKAWSLGLKTEEKDAETLIVRGTVKRIRELQAEIYKGEAKNEAKLYPKYWDTGISEDILTVPLKETSEEMRTIMGMFMRTMGGWKVKKVERIQNQSLLESFMEENKKVESKKASKMWMFYGSGEVDPMQIYMDCDIGFDLELRNMKEKKGFAFTFDARDAHEMFGYKVKGSKDLYKMLIADVVVPRGSNNMGDSLYIVEKSSQCCPLYVIEYEKN